jgi:hypothetical protein
VGIIASLWLLGGIAAAQAQSIAIDQTRYFATPEIGREELKSRMAEASAWPAAAPDDPKALLVYLQGAENSAAQWIYAPPTGLLRTFFGRDLPQQQLVDDSMGILKTRIQSLAELYKKSDAKH